MDRDQRPDDRRRRDDRRDYRSRNDRDRSRSPPPRERRDDRRRDRSPPRGPKAPISSRADRDRDSYRGRDRQGSGTPPPNRRPGDRGPPPRQPLDSRSGHTSSTVRRPDSRRDAAPDAHMQDGIEDEDEEARMQRLMGFKNFRTTKNTKVPGNDKNWAVYKVKKTEYRQYMNRQGGFNRALSPART